MTTHKGGKHSFADDPQKVSEAGRKGSGPATGGNVRSDTDRAEKARKGGQHSHGGERSGR
jgi:general stress protein YciG